MKYQKKKQKNMRRLLKKEIVIVEQNLIDENENFIQIDSCWYMSSRLKIQHILEICEMD